MKNKRVKISRLKSQKLENFFSHIFYWFKSLSIIKHIFVFYFFITLIGSIILYLPISHKVSIHYEDALFTSASAFSDTGLVTLTSTLTWTYFGQAVIAILILVGGLGWFALKVYLFNIMLGRPISFATREALASERGTSRIGVTRRLIKVSISIMLIIIVGASLVLSIYFYNVEVNNYSGPVSSQSGNTSQSIIDIPYHNWATSIRYGIFHSISAINNAGFDIMGESSISGYYYHYGIQVIFIVLFVLGGIGYPVIFDIYSFIKAKFQGKRHQWSLFTKVSMTTYIVIVILSICIAFLIETTARDSIDAHNTVANGNAYAEDYKSFWHNPHYGSKGDKSMAIIFNTMSTRNAGFATVDMHSLSSGTLLFYSILMFIGSAPSSTAGGIRTTTFAIILIGLWSKITGKPKINAFNRRIPSETSSRAYIVFVTAIVIVIIASLVATTSFYEHGGVINGPNQGHVNNGDTFTLNDIIFEVSSAFGTTGLSTGITPNLSLATKITLIIVMFIGQLGVSSTLLVWGKRNSSSKHYSFVKEDIPIG